MAQPATPTVLPTFCDFMPLEGSVWFKYDPQENAANCKDADQAQLYASRWTNKTYVGQLTAIDLNNVACAFLWKKAPDVAQAYALLKDASTMGLGKIPMIEANKRRAEQLLGPDASVGVPAQPPGGPKGGRGGSRVRVPAGKPRPGVSIRGLEESESPASIASRVGVPGLRREKPRTKIAPVAVPGMQKTKSPGGKTTSRVGVPAAKTKKPSGKPTASRPNSLKRTR
jgi:hypothetical protein